MRAREIALVMFMLAVVASLPGGIAQQRRPRAEAPPPPERIDVEELKDLQAVIETEFGTIVIEFFIQDAPRHVAYFIHLARQGFYDGTTFHRILPKSLIQGGDPLSRDPRTPREALGRGGLDRLSPEFNDRPFTRGVVGAVLRPGDPNSAGSQFFICVTDQGQLDRKFTAFGRVVEGMDVVEKIAETPTDADGLARQRIVMKSVRIRPSPLAHPEELKKYRVVLESPLGSIAIAMMPEVAPRHARHFVALAGGGFYDGTTFHRIYPGYLLLGGDPLTRGEDRSLWGRGWSGEFLPAEIGRIEFDRGIVGMLPMKPDDPNSGSAIFFICLGRAPHLDGKYTAFGRVVEGMEVLEKFEKLETDAQKAPVTKVPIRFRVVRVEEGR
ncbi:MAG: peptidylprolyl isomerase [Blastocatellia bacterium]|nr:peptidylprolyl isomerase [Blastocatellia bacterium]MCS7157946.1 peptidylprolyl isomerase [Blastocatellia bacterium]MCX7752453.1 peptidylprolyl isomerase [Blastocatellia bacterium]MDW8167432.1 peptidylprolyl isomerase [Acidobacteriota bacterium]MDW8257390.1 peptidylprolyl isomerase [Acidobacteriota bacterium]